MFHKKLRLSKHPLVFLTILILFIIGTLILAKLYLAKPTYVYVKMKVGQGLWWASTAKPSIWFVKSIKKGDTAYDLTGKPQAQVLSVAYYPSWSSNEYDVYLTVRLKVKKIKSTRSYNFNRSDLSVSSPLELQFPNSDITGTITEISPVPIHDTYVYKTVYLAYEGGYVKDFPYKYDSIQIGDSYFDGTSTVFTILDKQLEKNIWSVQNNLNAQIAEQPIETTQNIIVKAKVKLRVIDGTYYYGDEYRVYPNAAVPFASQNYFFGNFTVRSIE